ncbi:MAG: carbonic anhydrase [Bryobacteraceae bacterium]|nr:carbonic anhydrase [Bryobacterales bacterium]MEB2360250.1 carbonic anhydrase [Bryobacterales bacterium]NUN02154.1 carbonic anhydrase [Bryobacteraceae bacterium]
MKRILSGLSRFQNEIFPQTRQLFERLASSQAPEALFLTCSDSRIVPELITQTAPGDLFTCRNAGNIVPAYGEENSGVSATIEFAVLALGVKDIIICGHSDCGAMSGLLHPEQLAGMPNVAAWLKHAESARFIVQDNYPHLKGAELLNALIEENVVAQLANLGTHPSVASRLRKGKLQLHGWVYQIDDGTVTAFDPGLARFVLIGKTAGESEDGFTRGAAVEGANVE